MKIDELIKKHTQLRQDGINLIVSENRMSDSAMA